MSAALRRAALGTLAWVIGVACARPGTTLVPADIAPAVPVMTRAEWGALPPVMPMTAHKPRRLTIHHTGVLSDTARSLIQKLQGLQRFSQRDDSLASGRRKPAWPDVPYHYYIDIRGQVAEARDVRYVGDTNTEYDPTGHVLVVVEGNFEREQPNEAQLASLNAVAKWLTRRWMIPADSVAAHRDFARTSCPGAALYARMPALRAYLRD